MLPSVGQTQTTPGIRVGAHGVVAYTSVDPVPGNRRLSEVRVVQPVLMLHGGTASNRVRMMATVNLEGLTIPDGELALGDWGEGFVDRRHPHTYLHELMLTFDDVLGIAEHCVRISLSAGKGFAPFGTDDPMSRPVLRYPVNHHFAQVLERLVGILGVQAGPVVLEGALFNGDEPERPGQWPKVSRFGDSWAGRVTLRPVVGVELQGSHAWLNSPEHRAGAGTDQSKWSLSGRWSGAVGHYPVYGMLEWARTSEADGFFTFHSLLAEGAWTLGRSRLHGRFERTDRPEEERSSSPFRSRRPHFENTLLGQTRWTIYTAGYGFRIPYPPARLEALPLIELSYGRITDVGGGLFDARAFYGKNSFWSVSLGVRLSLGTGMHRMGRYGVAEDTAAPAQKGEVGHHDH